MSRYMGPPTTTGAASSLMTRTSDAGLVPLSGHPVPRSAVTVPLTGWDTGKFPTVTGWLAGKLVTVTGRALSHGDGWTSAAPPHSQAQVAGWSAAAGPVHSQPTTTVATSDQASPTTSSPSNP